VNRVTRSLRGFGAFWWDFIVGDDWVIAAAVVVALGGTALIARSGWAGWWLLPVVTASVLTLSLHRATRRR
jgi:hypothetical protein